MSSGIKPIVLYESNSTYTTPVQTNSGINPIDLYEFNKTPVWQGHTGIATFSTRQMTDRDILQCS